MNSKIQIGDHVKAQMVGCVPAYGIVAAVNNDNFIEIYPHDSALFAITQGALRFNIWECTKITPQEYFKQVLIHG